MPTPQQTYVDKLLGYANATFSTLHAKFLKEIWGDNKTTNKLHHNQCTTDWQNGAYEVYIPTRDNINHNLSYYRIAIQILPEISNEAKRFEAYKLEKHKTEPLGIVESELLILIAPRQNRWGIVRGFKHRLERGYFTAVLVNKSPEIVWKRILDLLWNFIQKRLDGFFRSLKIEPWIWKWAQNTENTMLYYSILERYSFVIRQSVMTLLKLYRHFREKMKWILHEIGIQNMAVSALKPLNQLNSDDLAQVFSLIREKLEITVRVDEQHRVNVDRRRGEQYLRALEVVAHG